MKGLPMHRLMFDTLSSVGLGWSSVPGEKNISDKLINPRRKLFVTALGVITLLCAVLFLFSFVFVLWQEVAGVYDGPILLLLVFLCTLPPAILCTVISLALVGPKHCKLAWISLCMFALLFVVAIGVALFAPSTKPH
jgi:hypothetical protein